MKGDAKVIDFLNEALKNELTAINQYWLHYRMLDNWGVARLAAFEREESIDEMKHADQLADRILFLGGLPNFQMLGRLRQAATISHFHKYAYCCQAIHFIDPCNKQSTDTDFINHFAKYKVRSAVIA